MLPKKYEHISLENKRFTFLELGFIISLLLVFFALELNIAPKESIGTLSGEAIVVEQEMVPITRQQNIKPPSPPKIVSASDIINIVADDVELEHDLEIVDSEVYEDESIEYSDDWNIDSEEEIVEEPIFIVVEEMPIFRPDICKTEDEGKLELMRYISNAIKYPVVAAENGITGRVYLSFVVAPDGSVNNIKVVRGVHASLDAEAIRVLSTLPRFSPGKQRGKPVQVQYSVPISFVLQ